MALIIDTEGHNRAMLWDIFCTVIDNHGDLGVCWRLACQLAQRGEHIRLWVDDDSALAWMAPAQHRPATISLRSWHATENIEAMEPAAQVWVEAFGCELPAAFIEHRRRQTETGLATPPVWINLEYLTAEAYAARCHGLPSPISHGPGRGWTKHFFYPGFVAGTGGLLRTGASHQALPDSLLQKPLAPGERLVLLFCYEPPGFWPVLQALQARGQPTRLLVAPGRPAALVHRQRAALESLPGLSIELLPYLPQMQFDQLLQCCDLNFVRGEDSLVQALWAGAPLIWQIYPQDDDAHHSKLQAYLDWLQAPASLSRAVWAWNLGLRPGAPGLSITETDLNHWAACQRQARQQLLAQDDLSSQLMRFALEKG